MCKKLLLVFLFGISTTYGQNIIAIQSFETSGDTWVPISFSTPPCSIGNDIWDYVSSLPGIMPSDGNQFWGIRDLDGSCGGTDFETLTLANKDISLYSNVSFSIDYNVKGFENSDILKYELFFDNISQGEVILFDGSLNNDTNNWETIIVSIPAGIANVGLILSAKNNANNDRAGFDNIRLYEGLSSSDNCNSATSLVVGANNTQNVITATNVGATDSGELPLPNCANYRGGDQWFSAVVPASGFLTIETLDAGGISDTGLSVYQGLCGNLIEIACDDNNGSGQFSMVNIIGLPNTTVYIRVWEKNNNDFGLFNIVAYAATCPLTTTWNGLTWSNGLPNAFTSTTINGNYDTNLNGSIETCNCTINLTSTVNVRANQYLTVHNDLTVNGVLEVRHEGSLVMTNDLGLVSSPGTVNVYKTTTPFNQYDYTYWSSPMEDETIGSALASSVPDRIYSFDTSIYNELTTNGWTPILGSATMQQGVGYIAMGPTTGNFPQTQDIVFDGQLSNGVIQTPIALSADSSKDYEDWNLIGNPYASAINANLLLSNPINTAVVSGTIYLWTHNTQRNANPGEQDYNSNDYATYTFGTGGVAATSGGPRPTGLIASGQGFFIDGEANSNLTFNNAMRVNSGNDQFFRTPDIITKGSFEKGDRLWLDLSNNKGAFNQLLVGFIDGATEGFDRNYDGIKFGGGWVTFYSILNDTNLAVQGKGLLTDDATIQLGFASYVEEGEELKISIANIEGEGILNQFDILLKDKYLDRIHDLNAGDYYFIIDNKGVFNDRFELLLTKKSVLAIDQVAIENKLIISSNNDLLIIKNSENLIIKKVIAYDIIGKTLIDNNTNSDEVSINTGHLNPGSVLIIKTIFEDNTSLSSKIILN